LPSSDSSSTYNRFKSQLFCGTTAQTHQIVFDFASYSFIELLIQLFTSPRCLIERIDESAGCGTVSELAAADDGGCATDNSRRRPTAHMLRKARTCRFFGATYPNGMRCNGRE